MGWRVLTVFLLVAFLAGFHVGGYYVNQELRRLQQNSVVWCQIMLVKDAFEFFYCGGDLFGFSNYFKWSYAVWVNSSERTWWQKALFWKGGLLYGALYNLSDPPAEYQYPLRIM